MEGKKPNERESDSIIRFACSFCGQRIRVPKAYAGKKGKCPKCGQAVLVPAAAISGDNPASIKPDAQKPDPSFDSFLNPPHRPEQNAATNPQISKDDQFEMLRQDAGLASLLPETPLQRQYPWLIDVLLYPANLQGLIFFVIVILVSFAARVIGIFVPLFGILLNCIIGMYIYWFLVQCARDSAFGSVRAPETVAETPGLAELIWQLLEILACLAVYIAPPFVYYSFTQRTDLPYWLIAGCGAFLYPMALLGVIMFDSINGLNPLIVIPSIFSVFFQYCGLVILIGAIVLLYVWMIRSIPAHPLMRFVVSPLFRIIGLYLIIVAAHLLGRFYFKYQKKLNWDV